MATKKELAEKRAWLRRSIRVKRQMLGMYADEVQRLEAQAADLRSAADAIRAGIDRAERVLKDIE